MDENNEIAKQMIIGTTVSVTIWVVFYIWLKHYLKDMGVLELAPSKMYKTATKN